MTTKTIAFNAVWPNYTDTQTEDEEEDEKDLFRDVMLYDALDKTLRSIQEIWLDAFGEDFDKKGYLLERNGDGFIIRQNENGSADEESYIHGDRRIMWYSFFLPKESCAELEKWLGVEGNEEDLFGMDARATFEGETPCIRLECVE